MINVPYTSIDSVLFDLSTVIDPIYWDEYKMREWAIKGFRKLNMRSKYELVNRIIAVRDHTGQLPSDTKYVNQLAYKSKIEQNDIEFFQEIMGLTSDDVGAEIIANTTLPAQAAAIFRRRVDNGLG